MKKNTQPEFKGFIVGQGRSGTTLLSAMLNRHSLLCVTPETHFYQYLGLYPGGIDAFIREYPKSLYKIMKQMDATNNWNPDPEPIVHEIKKISHQSEIKDIFLKLGELIAKQFNKSYWIEKTPSHIREIPLIDKIYPEQHMIHLIRDGRAVSESLNRMQWASDSYIENCLHWLWTMQLYYRFLKKRKNVITIRYEDLVLNPKNTLTTICQFIGLNFETSMLKKNEIDDYLIETGHQHKNKIKGAIDPSNIDLWKNNIPERQKLLADRLIGFELQKWGYDVNNFKYDSKYRVIISPFPPDGNSHIIIDNYITSLFENNKSLWVDKTLNIGEKIVLPPRYWVHFDELLPQRLCKHSKYEHLIYFITALLNILMIKITNKNLIFYYHPDLYNNCNWNLKRILIKLTLRLSTKVLTLNNDLSDIEKHYFPIKKSQKCNI